MAKTKRKTRRTSRHRSGAMTRIKVYKSTPPLNLSVHVPMRFLAEEPEAGGLASIMAAAGLSYGWQANAPYYLVDFDLIELILYEIGKVSLERASAAD